jgi:hypothetical protein
MISASLSRIVPYVPFSYITLRGIRLSFGDYSDISCPGSGSPGGFPVNPELLLTFGG